MRLRRRVAAAVGLATLLPLLAGRGVARKPKLKLDVRIEAPLR